MKEQLYNSAKEIGIELDETAVERFCIYFDFLIEYNKKVNLTAITDADGVLKKHFIDCLAFMNYLDIPKSAAVCDIGTGAGFPGVVLKIARPDIEITLIDSLNKRCVFLNQLLEKLSLEGEVLHLRAEEAGKDKNLRERFDIVTARAVSAINVLAELSLPLVKPGGIWAPLKGPSLADELELAKNGISILGGKLLDVCEYSLFENQRTIPIFKKISQTPTKYPRVHGKIAKNPL